ncbi:probable rhamnogalacturonate lyase B isoform X2 [Cucurbita maxima]|uniref:rhamnogalacturonan endolyase n=1 Tax=Cucurbita maxima TaxID=3661 RepID=A0A6J1JRT5_CUCMA|nr:probable rhamnogalacturonate lyase B isoform X2 [Cucurbita maxima]
MKLWGLALWCTAMAAAFFFFFFPLHPSTNRIPTTPLSRNLMGMNINNSSGQFKVRLQRSGGNVVMDNGIVQVTLSTPDGDVVGLSYNGIDNILDTKTEAPNRGYWDAVWNNPNEHINTDRLLGTTFKVIVSNDEQLEISFVKTWSVAVGNKNAPVNVDKRFVLLRGSSGFYTYAIFERLTGWPEIEMDQVRIVFRPQKKMFDYMAVSDSRQRVMPTMDDRDNGDPLAYPEAVLLTNPANEKLRGEVDDKYMYSIEDKDNLVHGWISRNPPTGFWMITPSDEFRVAGPVKQDLTSHAGPITLSMFVSTHYAGTDVGMKFAKGEPWKKVFGPVFVYLNSASPKEDYRSLWQDAKQQLATEISKWPYTFPQSEDFPSSAQRGSVAGRLLIRDGSISDRLLRASNAFVGLALPGPVGSWQRESKGYQFWTQADSHGSFLINNVREGVYNLYAFVPGFIGDYKYEGNITIKAGSKTKLDEMVFDPPRQGPTIWEIGIPDRTAAEFYVPDPFPTLMNKLYIDHDDKFRQYGLWERYAAMYPNNDLVFTVGVDNYTQDWFYAHVTRDVGNQTYEATTWEIRFSLQSVNQTANYTLQIALASAADCELQVRLNDKKSSRPGFTTGRIGRDNAIARHGIHGLYWLYSVPFPGTQFLKGNNSMYFTQARGQGPFQGLMYDYVRLEAPPRT